MNGPGGSLRGLRILVLRPEGQSEDLAQALSSEGAEPVVVPAIRLVAPRDPASLERVFRRGRRFDWLAFTSSNGVVWFRAGLEQRETTLDMVASRIAAIGPKTRDALEDGGAVVDWTPRRFTTEAMAEEFPGPPSDVCLVRAENAGNDLETVLRRRGFSVERVDAYRSEPTNEKAIVEAVRMGVDAIALTSASIVDSFVRAVGTATGGAKVCSIGPATSEAGRRLGLPLHVEAADHTAAGLVEAIREYVHGARR